MSQHGCPRVVSSDEEDAKSGNVQNGNFGAVAPVRELPPPPESRITEMEHHTRQAALDLTQTSSVPIGSTNTPRSRQIPIERYGDDRDERRNAKTGALVPLEESIEQLTISVDVQRGSTQKKEEGTLTQNVDGTKPKKNVAGGKLFNMSPKKGHGAEHMLQENHKTSKQPGSRDGRFPQESRLSDTRKHVDTLTSNPRKSKPELTAHAARNGKEAERTSNQRPADVLADCSRQKNDGAGCKYKKCSTKCKPCKDVWIAFPMDDMDDFEEESHVKKFWMNKFASIGIVLNKREDKTPPYTLKVRALDRKGVIWWFAILRKCNHDWFTHICKTIQGKRNLLGKEDLHANCSGIRLLFFDGISQDDIPDDFRELTALDALHVAPSVSEEDIIELKELILKESKRLILKWASLCLSYFFLCLAMNMKDCGSGL